MSKLGKKPQPKGSSIMKLLDNITFARFEWKVHAKFCHLAKIVVAPEDGEVDVKFQVPRQVVNYVSLDDEDTYKHMVSAALRGQNPSVNLAISYSEVRPKNFMLLLRDRVRRTRHRNPTSKRRRLSPGRK
jgi:hypothetical protein